MAAGRGLDPASRVANVPIAAWLRGTPTAGSAGAVPPLAGTVDLAAGRCPPPPRFLFPQQLIRENGHEYHQGERTVNAARGLAAPDLQTAQLLAVRVLLAEPEALGGDLEKHLCEFRDKLLADIR